MKRPLIMEIAGSTGSVKTTVTRKILNRLDLEKVVIPQHDSYYKDLAVFNGLPIEHINFDHPGTLETSLLIEHLSQLKRYQSISQLLYDIQHITGCQRLRLLSQEMSLLWNVF